VDVVSLPRQNGSGKTVNLRRIYQKSKENKMEEKSEGCTCHGCGRKYNVDLLLPDEIWEQISPKKVEGFKGGGLLCPMCIGQKLEAFGKPDWFHLVKCSPAAGPWIKVSERLPKVGKTVCAYTIFGYYRIATFNGKHFFKDNGGCLHARNVTHWAEINPPAEEK
jgi:hypothetical protein